MDTNIYSAPESSPENSEAVVRGSTNNAFVTDHFLWVNNQFEPPNICMKTGEVLPLNTVKKMVKAYYLPPAAYFAILAILLPGVGLLLVLIILSLLQKKLSFAAYFSDAVVRSRKRKLWISLACFLISVGAFVFSGMSNSSENIAVIIGALALLGSLISLSLSGFRFKAKGYDGNFFKLKGAHPIFLHYIETGEYPEGSTY